MTETKRERIDRLYGELRAGRQRALDTLIVELMPLVDQSAKTFAYRRPAFGRLLEEFISAGYLRITEVCIAAEAGEPIDNFRSFVLKSLDRAFSDTCDRDELVRPGKTAAWEGVNSRLRPGYEQISEEHAQYEEQQYAYELPDVMRCCDGEFEEDVIALRASGRTDRQIAARFRVSDDTVLRARRRVERRFQEMNLAIGA